MGVFSIIFAPVYFSGVILWEFLKKSFREQLKYLSFFINIFASLWSLFQSPHNPYTCDLSASSHARDWLSFLYSSHPLTSCSLAATTWASANICTFCGCGEWPFWGGKAAAGEGRRRQCGQGVHALALQAGLRGDKKHRGRGLALSCHAGTIHQVCLRRVWRAAEGHCGPDLESTLFCFILHARVSEQ